MPLAGVFNWRHSGKLEQGACCFRRETGNSSQGAAAKSVAEINVPKGNQNQRLSAHGVISRRKIGKLPP